MDDLYRELILDHYQHPHNHGEIPDADISYEDSNPLCGDKIRIDIKLKNNVVEQIKFNGKGCAISQASGQRAEDSTPGFGSLWKVGKRRLAPSGRKKTARAALYDRFPRA